MIYSPEEYFENDDYLQTSSGSIISRRANIFKPANVEIPNGRVIVKENVILRGDLASIQINKYVIISENCILRPSYGTFGDTFRFIPLTIGAHSLIGPNCIVESASIGVGCTVGSNCILSSRSILKDYVKIEDDTVVPPDMVIPPFAIVAGKPGRIVGDQSESTSTLAAVEASARYKNMKPKVK